MNVNCPECGGQQFSNRDIKATGLTVNLLPELGGFVTGATFEVIVCEACGLTRFYADRAARERLQKSRTWHPFPPDSPGDSEVN